ncbi:alpha/beta fold hydrolase, partial [Bacteriovoracaceae bacterium]|nr:alpha/beta fold hydrolase [Bacteriovoracaceae bacterium]
MGVLNFIPVELRGIFPFKSHFFTTKEKHKVHYVDEGKGPVVVMLHGNPTWSFYYRDLIKTLRTNYRVICPDHLGCGLSDNPGKEYYHLQNRIEVIEELLSELDIENFSLIVHDWGGAIGMGVAVNNPQMVNRIVYLNTAAFLSKEIPWRIMIGKFPFLGLILIKGFNFFVRLALVMAPYKRLPEKVKKGYLYPYRKFNEREAVYQFVKDIPLWKGHRSFHVLENIDNKLNDLKCPKLFCWGAKDFCFHLGFLERWKKIYPDAKYCVYK